MPTDTLLNLCALLILAGEHGFLKKAVFSKCADPNVLRAAGRLFAKDAASFCSLNTKCGTGKPCIKIFPQTRGKKSLKPPPLFRRLT